MPPHPPPSNPPDSESLAGLAAKRRDIQDRLGVVLDALAEGVTFHDDRGVILFPNSSALRILGLTLDELCGRDSFDPRWRAVTTDGAVAMTAYAAPKTGSGRSPRGSNTTSPSP